MRDKPRIAVILDENTSGDARRYEASKGYFKAIGNAGGLPFGIPYLPEVIDVVVNDFQGLLCVGGRFAYPDNWYLPGKTSMAPHSERFEVERAIVEGFLTNDKPILRICAGMQLLAGINGCRLWPDVRASSPQILEHDKAGHLHSVTVAPHTKLAALVQQPTFLVNSFHREAIADLTESVIASAQSDDGVIEAIELPKQSFTLGLQWHQELFTDTAHAGNGVFRGLIEACR
jgi:putative glutamine amidotransferase